MNPLRAYRKFNPQKQKIEELEQKSPRFKRIYSEYESMSDDLWDLENTDASNIPDDFLEAIKLQTEYLEEEIDNWLLDETKSVQLKNINL
ncbi:hypothetical protein [Chryseobacterium sp. HSC-36S06]|uniref:hypothetical protein n=1 Tax=Chryseobacterium sp. HSC-36S06 TaxID=2910970 RepID=UPI00209F2173|nr:hypothetical protein [Chryseobacterium sp. HSC-36S06]MCP2038947.1 uncharacterized protein YdcH (DUF465 family) [Chryseobacterium sp. HSC-36S06]